tara:strand:+ start:733 stop:1863 length:1131 start_codon:yes stop_codon:yes gene_type:complete
MASTFTANSGIEKPGSGEQAGTWGSTTNANFDIIDRVSNGVGAVTLSGTTHTLTTTDGALSDGHYKVLVLGGSPSGTNTVTISPNDQDKLYFVHNTTNQSVTFTQGSGGNVTVEAAKTKIIFADGAGSGAKVTDFTAIMQFTLDAANLTGTIANARLDQQLQDVAGLAVTDGNVIVGNGSNFVAENGSTARTSLGVAIGSDVQAHDADLDAIAGLTSAANKGIQFTGSGSAGTYDLTAAGKALLDDADAAAQRTTLGLGSAATLTAGTSANNAVQLDGSAKLPALDGSQLTGISDLKSAGAVGSYALIYSNVGGNGVQIGDTFTTPGNINMLMVSVSGTPNQSSAFIAQGTWRVMSGELSNNSASTDNRALCQRIS